MNATDDPLGLTGTEEISGSPDRTVPAANRPGVDAEPGSGAHLRGNGAGPNLMETPRLGDTNRMGVTARGANLGLGGAAVPGFSRADVESEVEKLMLTRDGMLGVVNGMLGVVDVLVLAGDGMPAVVDSPSSKSSIRTSSERIPVLSQRRALSISWRAHPNVTQLAASSISAPSDPSGLDGESCTLDLSTRC